MKIGLFGGTFDPIHRAHVSLADTAVKQLNLDELYFIPAYVSPFKLDKHTESGSDRYNMICEILHYNDAFRVSDYELRKKGTSYTIDTLMHFKEEYQNDCELFFMLGYDSLVQIDTWHKGPQILKGFNLVTVTRPGISCGLADAKIDEFVDKYQAKIILLDMPQMNISSTIIRKRIANGNPISNLVMPEVEEYIFDNKLYQ